MEPQKFLNSVLVILAFAGGLQLSEADSLTLEERVTALEKSPLVKFDAVQLHGGVIGFYQGANRGEIGSAEFDSANGAGFAVDLELSFSPASSGEVYMRLHAGSGDGSDSAIEEVGAIYADLNTINDDNPEGDAFDLLEVFYVQQFAGGSLALTVGQTESVIFIDDNAYANNEAEQFIGKAFVNSISFDSEQDYAPLVALEIYPEGKYGLNLVLQSTSRPRLGENEQKDNMEDVFTDPFFAFQARYSPQFGARKGNYRLYGFLASYEQPELTGLSTEQGWGLGLSIDQQLSDIAGLFLRYAYSNEDVYEIPSFYSVGVSLSGVIPERGSDELGIGYGALVVNNDLPESDTEHHVEFYYRAEVSDTLSIGPHIQLAVHPAGSKSSDTIIGGVLRASAVF